MAQFNAQGAVEALEYDFRPHVDAHGVIPEPSTGQIQAYFDGARDLAKGVQGLRSQATAAEAGDLSEEQMAEIVEQIENLDIAEYMDQIVHLVAALCSNEPSAEQIFALPFRIRQAFVKWVGAQFRS